MPKKLGSTPAGRIPYTFNPRTEEAETEEALTFFDLLGHLGQSQAVKDCLKEKWPGQLIGKSTYHKI